MSRPTKRDKRKNTNLKISRRELKRETELIIFLHTEQARRLLAAIDAAMETQDFAQAISAMRAAKRLITQLEDNEILAMLRGDLEDEL